MLLSKHIPLCLGVNAYVADTFRYTSGKFGHTRTLPCDTGPPGTTEHRDRQMIGFCHAKEVDAIRLVPSMKGGPPRA